MASSNGSSVSVGSNPVEVKQKHTGKAVPVEVRRELWKVCLLVSHLSKTNGHAVSGIQCPRPVSPVRWESVSDD